MKKEDELPIYEVRGECCEGVLQDGRTVKDVSFRRIKSFLKKEVK
jgi:hypothetical protein